MGCIVGGGLGRVGTCAQSGGRGVGAAGTGGKSWLLEGKADTFPGKCLGAPGWGALNARIRGGYRVRALPYESQGAQLDDNVLLNILPISFALPWLLHPVLPAMWRRPRPDLLTKGTNLFFLFFFVRKQAALIFSHMHPGI